MQNLNDRVTVRIHTLNTPFSLINPTTDFIRGR